MACLLVCAGLNGASGALACPTEDDDVYPEIPRHLYVTPSLRPLVAEMLQGSVTFRGQIERVARTTGLGISLGLRATTSMQPASASIRHYDTGLILVAITIHTLNNQVELVAHEIEHVLEQIERQPLARLARNGSGRVWTSGNSFETLRAIDAGRRVAREMRQAELSTQ